MEVIYKVKTPAFLTLLVTLVEYGLAFGQHQVLDCVRYHQSHKKSTEFSRTMDLRNRLLVSEDGLDEDDYRTARARRGRQVQPRSHDDFFGNDTLASVIVISCTDDGDPDSEPEGGACNPQALYRTITGRCNNLAHPKWGSSNTALKRYLPPAYADGLGVPRGGFDNDGNRISKLRRGTCLKPDTAHPLPNPRRISTTFHPDNDVTSAKLTHMVAQFGQFLDHDLTFTPESSLETECCQDSITNIRRGDCFAIPIPDDDPFFRHTSVRCISFARSSSFCLSKSRPREQMNTLTAFLDCSHTYGSTANENRALRTFQDGLLRVSFHGQSARELLPQDRSGFFLSGDVRGTEMPALAAMHTLFIREHNRIARHLHLRQEHLPDEALYQKARKICIAEWQNIVYTEYLPIVLGRQVMKQSGTFLDKRVRSRYDPKINPSVSNSFATAAFRFGHTQIQGLVHMIASTGTGHNRTYHIRDNFFTMNRYLENDGHGLEGMLLGLTMQPAGKRDRFIDDEVTNTLFPGIDLIARNVQRGRDHGLPGYNEYRQFCGMPRLCSWDQVPAEMSASNWRLLSQIYEHPNDVDLFPGAMAEENYLDGIVGRTFSCLLDKTFKSLKDGDRFFFTHKAQNGVVKLFNRNQLRNLRKRTLRDIICENSDIEELPVNVFLLPSIQDSPKPCTFTNRLDFDLFV